MTQHHHVIPSAPIELIHAMTSIAHGEALRYQRTRQVSRRASSRVSAAHPGVDSVCELRMTRGTVSVMRAVLVSLLVAILLLTAHPIAAQEPDPNALLTPAPTPAIMAEEAAPASRPDVVNGSRIYARKCQACHGETGQGNGPRAAQVREQGGQVVNLLEPARFQSAEPSAWFDVVSNGRIERLMPGFSGSLTPQDRWDVLSYLWAMGTPSDTLRAGSEGYAAQCAACHGAQGVPPDSQLASLSAPAFLAGNSLLEIAQAMVTGDAHKVVTLDEGQRAQVAGFVRSLGYEYADPAPLREMALQGDGVLQLQAENFTPGGPTITALPVTLHAYDSAGEVFSRTAMLDSQGLVTFTELPRNEGYFYQADVIYNGAKFFAAPQQITETAAITTALPIYEVTNDASVISIGEFHYFVQQAGEGSLTVVEFYLFNNSSDRAYIDQPGPGGQLRSLKISVPPDAENLRFDGPGLGERFFRDGDTLYDSDAVPPGERTSTIVMLYDIPYQGSRKVERRMPYSVGGYDVLLPDGPLRVNGLTDKGVQALDIGSIRMYESAQNASTVPAGGSISFELVGQPRGAPVPGDDGRAIGFGLVALALAGAMAFVLVTRMRHLRAAEAGLSRDLTHERQTLLAQIADLDNRFTDGKLQEPAYRKERARLKAQLREIWE